jgi:hypothetical protein
MGQTGSMAEPARVGMETVDFRKEKKRKEKKRLKNYAMKHN